MGDVISKRSDEFSEKKCPLPANDQVQDQLQCSVANTGSNDVWTAVTVSKENGVLTREGKTFHIVAGKQNGDVLLVPTDVSLREGENTSEARIEEHCTPHAKVTGHTTTILAQEELNPSTSQSRDKVLMNSNNSSESGQLSTNAPEVPDRKGDYGLEENVNEEIELTENELVALFRYNMLADATNVLKTLKTDLSVRTSQPAGTRHSKDKSPTHLPPVHHGNQLTSSVPTKEALLAMSGNSPPDSLPHLKTKRTDRQNNAGISLLKPRSIMIGGPSSNSMWSDTPKRNHPPEDKPGLVKRARATPTKLWKQSSVDKKTSPNILSGKPHPPLRRSPVPPLKSPQQFPSAALATSPSKSGPLSPNNHVSKHTMSFSSSGKEVHSSTKTVLSKGNKITLSAIDHDLLKSSNPGANIARGDQKSKNSSYLTGPSPFARPDALNDKVLSMYSEVEDLRGLLRAHLNLMEGQPKDRGIIKVDHEEEPVALEVVAGEDYTQEAIDAAVMIQKHFRRYRTQKELVQVKKSVNAIQKMFKKWYCKSRSNQAPLQSSYSSCMSETSVAEVSGIVTSDTARQVVDKGELSKLTSARTLGDIPEETGQGSCQTANPGSEDRSTVQEPGTHPEALQNRDDNHGNSIPSSEDTVVNPESGTNSKLNLTKWNLEFNRGVQNPAGELCPRRPMRVSLATTHQFGQLSTLADRLRRRLSWTESVHGLPAVQDDNKEEESGPNLRKTSVVMAKKTALGKGIKSKKDFFDGYRAEIDRNIQLMNEMAELALGEDYEPRKVLLISNKVPKYQRLAKSAHPDVITIVYDHEEATLTSILTEIQDRLNSYRQGAKIKSMAISCKGTPGCFYILARRPVTPAKLRMDAEMRMFWQLLGTFMSSLGFGQPTTLHLMESNCAGNKQGEEVCEEDLFSETDEISDLVDQLIEKNSKTRLNAIAKLKKLFTSKYVGDLLSGNLEFLTDALARGLRKAGGNERQELCRLFMLLAVQVGEEGEVMVANLNPQLLTIARDPSVRIGDRCCCLHAAGLSSYLAISDPKELTLIADEFTPFLSMKEEVAPLCKVALTCWSLLLSVCRHPSIVSVVKNKVPILLALLESKSLDVKISAGQAAALLFELIPQDCESVDEEWDKTVGKLEDLAGQNSRHVERKERNHQRVSFRDIHQSVESGYVSEQKVSIHHEKVILNSWARIMQYNAIKELLGAGTATHMKENPFLRETFGLPPVHEKQSLEARLSESKEKKLVYALVAKERSKTRGKQRDKRTETFT